VKIRLPDRDGEIETTWAEPVGDHFRIWNLPWFAYGVGYRDIVEARPTERRGFFDFVRVVEPSGNHLIRVFFEDGNIRSLIDQVETMGCKCEGATKQLFAISVPPAVSLREVARLLMRSELTFELANPTYEDLFLL
jgi:hypothetical protein